MKDEILEKELKMVDFSGAAKENLLKKLIKMHRADNRSSLLSAKRISAKDLDYVAAAGKTDTLSTKSNNEERLF